MLLRSVTAIFSGLLLVHTVLARLTPDEAVTNIGLVTKVWKLEQQYRKAHYFNERPTSSNHEPGISDLSFHTSCTDLCCLVQTAVVDFGTIIISLAADVTAMAAT